jgi:putative Mg2+ transporter-C (MgtC) family protein
VTFLEQLQLLGELLGAMLLGGLIGLEREAAEKSAGFRTHTLVAGAACLLVGIGLGLVRRFASDAGPGVQIRADPIRMVEAVITGLSFLGAGTIFRSGVDQRAKGLTTAASILFSGAIGIGVAARLYLLAVGATILALVVLRSLQRVEGRLVHRTDRGEPPTPTPGG